MAEQDISKKADINDLIAMYGEEEADKILDRLIKDAKFIKEKNIYTAQELYEAHPHYRPVLIDGLLRCGEIMNLISASKRGKTWIAIDLALSVATGTPWMGMPVKKGRALIVDNELHRETIAQRAHTVAEARAFTLRELGDDLTYMPLRGRLRDIRQISESLIMSGEQFDLIIVDAFYRAYPAGTNENDNHLMAELYNHVDQLALSLNASIVLVHHATKGTQFGKAITDVGSGAGSFSRATDTHAVLLPHQEPDAAVFQAVPRTFKPIEERCWRYVYPIWVDAPDLNPEDVAGAKPRKMVEKENGQTAVAPPTSRGITPKEFCRFVPEAETSWIKIMEVAKAAGYNYSDKKVRELLKSAALSGLITEYVGKNNLKTYSQLGASLINGDSVDVNLDSPGDAVEIKPLAPK